MTSIFEKHKNEIMSNLRDGINDNSPRGHVDIPISELVNLINTHPDYVTTSSCSGRISVFIDENQSKGVKWILVKHAQVSYSELNECILENATDDKNKIITMKCEPMILHVECRTTDAARTLHAIAMECGLRESGITLGQKKTMLAIRTTSNSLELPIVIGNKTLLADEGLEYVVNEANKRLFHNFQRIDKLVNVLKDTWKWPRFQHIVQSSSHIANNRWGHNLVLSADNQHLNIIGGYGVENGSSRSSRSIGGISLSLENFTSTEISNMVVDVMHACTSRVSFPKHKIKAVIISGGRQSPSTANPCIFAIKDLYTFQNIEFLESGDIPCSRWGHTLSATRNEGKFLLVGGRNESTVYDDIYLLQCSVITDHYDSTNISLHCVWEKLPMSIGPLFFHAACELPYYYQLDESDVAVIVHGGIGSIIEASTLNHAYVILLSQNRCYSLRYSAGPLPPRFGHSLTYIGNRTIVMLGGSYFPDSTYNSPDKDENYSQLINIGIESHGDGDIYVKSIQALVLCPSNELPCASCRCHHQTFYDARRGILSLIGGGAMCLAFGAHYCSSNLLTINMEINLTATQTTSNATNSIASIVLPDKLKPKEIEPSPAILVHKLVAHKIKMFLETNNWLDKTRRLSPVDLSNVQYETILLHDELSNTSEISINMSGLMSVPITSECLITLKSNTKTDNPLLLGISSCLKSTPMTETAQWSIDRIHLLSNSAAPVSKSILVNHNRKAIEFLDDIVSQCHLPKESTLSYPKKFECVGDVLMIPEESFDAKYWSKIFYDNIESPPTQALWLKLASIFGMKRVARKARIDQGPKRESHVKLLCPWVMDNDQISLPIYQRPGWVEVTENQIAFGFDITRIMFCSGNVTERMRMSKQATKNQIIVDLYCGIGYYTLPFLVHGQAKHVHACEWNINSVNSIQYNLQKNKVADRCSVYHGDNQITLATNPSLHGIADRVCLGLLPSSTKGWPLAVKALKSTGGIIHVHENVMERDIPLWIEETIEKFREYFREEHGASYQVTQLHLEKVKSYAPRVLHVVLDLSCHPE